MRKSIDGLCTIIQEQFSWISTMHSFLLLARRCDRIKAILKEPDGIVLIYKRLTVQGRYRWPRDKSGGAEPYMEGIRLADVGH
ncbi:MAG: IS66 family insertion sequence element accessory protein TnpB [Enterocloster clostridioformis]